MTVRIHAESSSGRARDFSHLGASNPSGIGLEVCATMKAELPSTCECARRIVDSDFFFALARRQRYFRAVLSDGVMVALGPLEASVMVRIHVGQPILPDS